MPTPFLSLAAAAAAADAYLRGSPGARAGNGAGFMGADDDPLVLAVDVCKLASAGSGDFNCVEGLRVAELDPSDTGGAFCFPPGGLISTSGSSSAMD